MEDRRSGNRPKSLLGGRIVYNNRASTCDCTIRNMSDTGARLVFSTPIAAPDEFDLIINQKEHTYRCKIAWRNANEIGVNFLDEKEAGSPVPLDFAKRIKILEEEKAALQRRIDQLTSGI